VFPCRFPAKLPIIAARRAQAIEGLGFLPSAQRAENIFPEFTRAAGKRGQPVRRFSHR